MALTYAQLDALTTDPVFLPRVRTAVAKHAAYWQINAAASDRQKGWCEVVLRGGRCAQVAADLARELVMDPAFAAAVNASATDVLDAPLGAAVDAICEKYT